MAAKTDSDRSMLARIDDLKAITIRIELPYDFLG